MGRHTAPSSNVLIVLVMRSGIEAKRLFPISLSFMNPLMIRRFR